MRRKKKKWNIKTTTFKTQIEQQVVGTCPPTWRPTGYKPLHLLSLCTRLHTVQPLSDKFDTAFQVQPI